MAWRASSTPPPPPRPARTPAVAASSGTTPDVDEETQQDEARKEAFQRGFSEGRTVGHSQAAAEVQPVMDRLTRSLSDLSSIRNRVRKAAEAD